MKKFLLSLWITSLSIIGYSQCSLTAISSESAVVCGQCVDLNAIGYTGTALLSNTFDGGTLGPGWSTTPGASVFTNPCDPSFDGGTYLWMGSATGGARELATAGFDLVCGGQVCFYLDFATQGGTGDCEGPDIAGTEGVYFEYSIDGGLTWIGINTFEPEPGGAAGVITSWNQYCFSVPDSAQTANTMFHWIQPGNSGTCCDHWGIDNVEILANDCNYYFDWAHIPGSPDPANGGTVCPGGTSTYSVIYTNGIDDTCITDVTVNVLFPTVTLNATPGAITTCGGCTQLDATLSNIPPDTCCYVLDMFDSFGDGWNGANIMVDVTNGPSLGPFSATGTSSTISFCVESGQTFMLNYAPGAWESEVTYMLIDPSGNSIFNDGTFPGQGAVFGSTANCSTGPPVYNWTWSGPGLTAINDSTQTACPAMSAWYYVTVDAGGCSSIDSIFIDVTGAPFTSTENIDICSGTDYTFPDGTVQLNNIVGMTYVSTLITTTGCDSIITTNLNIVPVINILLNPMVCSGDNFTFPDGTIVTNIVAQVTQVSNYITAGGCDSNIITVVDANPIYNIAENVTICNGDNYTFPDGSSQTNIVAPVSYVSTLATVSGCDSLITTNVAMAPIYNIIDNVNVCIGDGYTFPDGVTQATILAPTTYVSSLTTTLGCDSVITTNVAVDSIYSISENVNVCDGSNYTFPDGFTSANITSATTHISNLTTLVGCDSIITTNVGVFSAYTTTIDTAVCDGSSYTWADGTTSIILSPTVWSQTTTLASIDGCDSLVTENVNIYPNYNLVESFDQCPGNSFTYPDGSVQANINSNVTYVSNLTTINGCDSTITTNVNIFVVPAMDMSFSINGCAPMPVTITNNVPGANYSWQVSGPSSNQSYTNAGPIANTYFNQGLYDVTLTMESADGCPMDTTIIGAFEVYPNPIASFDWNPNEGSITNNLITFNNTSIGSTSYEWDFGDSATSTNLNEAHSYIDSGHYDVELIAINDWGCTDTADGTVIINEEFFIFVPNAFSPDGDIHNSIFKPIVTGHNPDHYTLSIFNRWGDLIFKTDNANTGWDGSFKGSPVQVDTYVWRIDVWTFDNRRKDYIGHVVLVR